MILGTSCGVIKVWIYTIVPRPFAVGTKAFGSYTVYTIVMSFSLDQASSNFLQLRSIENVFNGFRIKITQHVRVTSTTGFDIAPGVDVQTSPWRRTEKVAHGLLILVFRRSNKEG